MFLEKRPYLSAKFSYFMLCNISLYHDTEEVIYQYIQNVYHCISSVHVGGCVHTCVRVCVYTYVCVCVCVRARTFTCTRVCLCLCLCGSVCVWLPTSLVANKSKFVNYCH